MGSVCKTQNTIRLSRVTVFLAPFAVVLGDQEIPSLPVYHSPVANLSFRNLRRQRGSGCGGPRITKVVILQWAKLGWEPKKKCLSFRTKVFLKMLKIFFFFCLPAVHSVDLNRCSPSASHYLQHPPIICFTNLPPPPSPLLASPLILNLDHPSAARNCVNTAYEDASHWAYIINAALTIAKLYLFMYLHRHISLKVSVYTKATTHSRK